MIVLWIYENHICELRSEELNEGWSSQFFTQLLQLRKKAWKFLYRSQTYRFTVWQHIFE